MKLPIQTFILLSLCIVNLTVMGQQQDSEIQKLQSRIQQTEQLNRRPTNQLRTTETRLAGKIKAATDSVEQLQAKLKEANVSIQDVQQKLGIKIDKSVETTNEKITDLTTSLSKNTLYWIIAVLSIAFLSLVLFMFLRNRFTRANTSLSDSILQTNKALEAQHTTLSDSIQNTRKALEEEGVRLDTKLADLLDTQLSLLKQERQDAPSEAKKEDHSLALKMADEINRIQKNLNHMDTSTKGIKQLNASVSRIIENFEANDYELVNLLNKPYDQGMKVIAFFRPDENLKSDEQVITRIIKPQVNYKGVMIQAAEIEVSQGV